MLRICGASFTLLERIVYGIVARHPQCAFVQVRHEFTADIGKSKVA